MQNLYLTLFKTFFKIGAFTLGGGYAMIPIIEEEVVNKHKWATREEMLDLIAVAQSCPGVFAINISTFIGYKLRKKRGALCTTLGTALPSFVIILVIALFFHRFMDVPWVAAMFRGIRPAVVALIAAPTFNLAKRYRIVQLLDTHNHSLAHRSTWCKPYIYYCCGGSGRLSIWTIHKTDRAVTEYI